MPPAAQQLAKPGHGGGEAGLLRALIARIDLCRPCHRRLDQLADIAARSLVADLQEAIFVRLRFGRCRRLIEQIVDQPVGQWIGPVTSAFGVHLVRVDAFEPGRASELSEVRDAVYRDLTSDRTRRAEEQFFDRLLAQYTVTVDWPEGMEPLEIPGVTP